MLLALNGEFFLKITKFFFRKMEIDVIIITKGVIIMNKTISSFVGTVGERVSRGVHITRMFDYYHKNTYGDHVPMKCVIFTDVNGNKLKWFTNAANAHKLIVGKIVHLRATVTRHHIYKGEHQTIISRPAIRPFDGCNSMLS